MKIRYTLILPLFLFIMSCEGEPTDWNITREGIQIIADIESGDLDEVSADLGLLDSKMDDLLTCRSTIGARVNRLELQEQRLESTKISYTGLMSQIEDADMEGQIF